MVTCAIRSMWAAYRGGRTELTLREMAAMSSWNGVPLRKSSWERFEIPEEFHPEEQLRQAFGIVAEPVMAVRVRFSAEVADAVRDRSWHESQQMFEEPDGGIVVSFEAGGRLEIIAWILSFGVHAVVLEPESLRDEIRRTIREMGHAYEQNC